MNDHAQISKEELRLEELRAILLHEDREALASLRNVIEDRELLSEKVGPIIEQKINFFKEQFPSEFEGTINKIIEEKIKDSQEEILNVIYPMMGKMIKKFITLQFQMLKDSIDQQVKNTFSKKGFLGKIKATIFGVRDSEVILSEMDDYELEEIYIIQMDSGLLMGKASKQLTVDQDVIAGMLTAIKAFVEDAFKKEEQELEMIEYGNYKIVIQNFHTYYMAVALSGSMSTSDRDQLGGKLLDFADRNVARHQQMNATNFEYLSEQLQQSFFVS